MGRLATKLQFQYCGFISKTVLAENTILLGKEGAVLWHKCRNRIWHKNYKKSQNQNKHEHETTQLRHKPAEASG